MNNITDRLNALRQLMKDESIDAFIFPSTDPHNGEYVPDHWKGREYISGFNGSAGTAVVTMEDAALWTDSRYFIAAEEQLKGTGFRLMKLKIEGTPTIAEWLGQKLAAIDGAVVGLDGMVNSVNTVERLADELTKQGGITIRTNLDPLKTIWTDRPEVPEDRVEIHPMKYAGENAESKIRRIREELKRQHAVGMLMSALDDIAWTLNMRGTDVHCNPVFVAYLLIDEDDTTLFVNPEKLDTETRGYLKTIGVKTADYEQVEQGLKKYKGYNILLDPDETSYTLYKAYGERPKVMLPSPVPAMKAVTNETERDGYRTATRKDGEATVQYLR